MTAKRVRKDGQSWHNNIGRWVETLSAEQRSALFQRSARVQWGPQKETPKKADDGPWTWPIALSPYDRCAMLTKSEEDMLTRYAEAYRFYRYGRTMDFGPSLNRLVQPLNDALDYTGIKTNHCRYVLLFFLREMAERKRSFWGWTIEEWIDSIERRRMERQHIVAIAYLLCGFADLHRLKFDHIVYGCLARKVFGREDMRTVSDRVHALPGASTWRSTRRSPTPRRRQNGRSSKMCKLTTEAIVSESIDKGELRKVCIETEPHSSPEEANQPRQMPASRRSRTKSLRGSIGERLH